MAPRLQADTEGPLPAWYGAALRELPTTTRTEAIDRATEWVDAGLLYCQSANGGTDSHGLCLREGNPAWDPYRSDCSGLVSYAWGLPPPGATTATLAPFDESVSFVIPARDLLPGDALNKKGHVMLFESFIPGGVRVIEEFDFRQPAARRVHEMQLVGDSMVRNGVEFFAIRYRGITGGAPRRKARLAVKIGAILVGAVALGYAASQVAKR